eukprot:CAMPEP_0185479336 /NCGR_PEP_ID=MMETSP1366-20130426/5423_1 /TAXON_ID=38817 /ORGANISM="Gephyrocapsa oceanica, Strain RCC1303" /LENGTH=58 /DNA_ID=CAMNT_0028086719 /DNA_START=90 /DNA_END=262 /DNA_ORIENTATION=+
MARALSQAFSCRFSGSLPTALRFPLAGAALGVALTAIAATLTALAASAALAAAAALAA